ncbi:MAG TPA: HDOD domain-containing protein [Phycisphaerae bacterium]|nr:HDOD domain-containing protein [Phycisphaerae bacterium]
MQATNLTTSVFVARQPIFHRAKNVHGYELLFRSGRENRYDGTDGDACTLDVIAHSFATIGLDELTAGQRGFINFTRNLLLQDVVNLLPPDQVTVEVLENINPDEEVIAACRRLKDAGYTLALDDFVLTDPEHPLLDLADIVKIDFMATPLEEQKRVADVLNGRKIKALAEKVETDEEFRRAEADGYTYFQGYFFAKPSIHEGKDVSASKLARLRLLEQMNRPEVSVDEIEGIIKQDVGLAYKLLRFINSAWFGLRHKIQSIRHALVWLGPKEVRKWFALISLRDMGTDKSNELFLRAMTRAKMGEGVAPITGMQEAAPELFLMGMFSLMDAILDMPMSEVLTKLPLDDQIKTALLGGSCPYRWVYDLIAAYEQGHWEAFSKHAGHLRIDEDLVPPVFNESIKWANRACACASDDGGDAEQ